MIAFVAFGWSGCSGSDSAATGNDGALTECPPAPVDWKAVIGMPCALPEGGCAYEAPSGFDGMAELCATTHLTCLDGKISFGYDDFTFGCCPKTPADIYRCFSGVVEGEHCATPTGNSECVTPDDAMVCACDEPGPIWRCSPVRNGIELCEPYLRCQGSRDCPAGYGCVYERHQDYSDESFCGLIESCADACLCSQELVCRSLAECPACATECDTSGQVGLCKW